MATWADVVSTGTRFPEVAESTSYGTPCLKVNGALMCRLKEDGESLMVRVVDLEDKAALLREDPEVFHTTPHYDGYAAVLVRLGAIGPARLGELVEDAWRLRAPKRALKSYDN